LYSDYICVNPYYPVSVVREGVDVLLDSGAFQDVGKHTRLTFQQALERQLACERKCGFVAGKIVSYDWLIDEQIDAEGKQVKKRWETDAAEEAVVETIEAARFLARKRAELSPRQLVLSCQGTTIEQYTRCAYGVLESALPGDVLGYGGFCIVGQRKNSLTPDGCTYPEQFLRILEVTLPLLQEAGITEAHVFGVLVTPLLREAYSLCKQFGVELSTDSSSVETNSVIHGNVCLDDKMRLPPGVSGAERRAKKWLGGVEDGDPPAGYWHPNILVHENIARAVETFAAIGSEWKSDASAWSDHLRRRKFGNQLSLFDLSGAI
jgi:hypothetical protein